MFGFLVVLILTQFFKSAQPSVISNLIRMENLDPGRDQDYGNLPPNLSTIELITRRGYPVHKHDIVTKDGYILTAFRIPHGKSWASHGYPVYIMHGGAMSSSDWLVNLSEDNCLPFLLANQGYDVWLGNLRGNMYSNRHINLTHNDPLFWNYGMDEVAKYDIPDAIDYILEKSKRRKLHFLGYSIGNTPFYMTMASRPEYNEKIGIHVSYAASVFFSTFPVSNRINALITTRPLSILQKLIGGFPVPPEGITFMVNQILSTICKPSIDLLGVCRQVLFIIMGFSPEQISREQTPSVLGHLMTPSSLKMLLHLNQFMITDRFACYDYGERQNLKIYGNMNPPEYNLKLITAPISLVLARNDMFANSVGYQRLANVLPNLVDYYTIPSPTFSHIDFVYGANANEMVYNHTINLFNKFSLTIPSMS